MKIRELINILKDLDIDESITIYDAFTGDAYRHVDVWQIDGDTGISLVINKNLLNES